RHGPRAASARLQLRASEESAAWRAAFGSVREACGRKADRGGWLAARIAQDERPRQCARQTELCEIGFACFAWRKSQPGTREPQHRRGEAFGTECASAIRRLEARPTGSFEGCGCAPRAFARSGKEADRSAACGNDCSCPGSKERSCSKSRSEKAHC